jgi:hypothetical protein
MFSMFLITQRACLGARAESATEPSQAALGATLHIKSTAISRAALLESDSLEVEENRSGA